MKQGKNARHKSALKRARQNIKRNTRNNTIRSIVKNSITKVRASVAEKNSDDAALKLKQTVKLIDKACSKGIFHKNTGSRKISRLNLLVNSIPTS